MLNKVALVFKEAFWSSHRSDFFGRLVGDPSRDRGLFFLFFNGASCAGPPALFAIAAGDAAVRLEELSDGEASEQALCALRSIFGASTVPPPVSVHVTRWRSDRFARGSYSYVKTGSRGGDYSAAGQPVDGRLFFAGEHTSEEHPATVVGAHLSGVHAAHAVRRALGGAEAASSRRQYASSWI